MYVCNYTSLSTKACSPLFLIGNLLKFIEYTTEKNTERITYTVSYTRMFICTGSLFKRVVQINIYVSFVCNFRIVFPIHIRSFLHIRVIILPIITHLFYLLSDNIYIEHKYILFICMLCFVDFNYN